MSYLLGVVAAALFAVQTAPAPAPSSDRPAQKDASKPITLSGCVARDASTPGQFTLQDRETGGRYRLLGVGLRKYAGQRVEVVGGPVGGRLAFRGGLLPSPNAAAQAGAADPGQSAIASMPGGAATGTGDVQLPEFRVTHVQSVSESCR